MEGFLKQSTAVNVTVLVISSTDHISGKTGLAAGLTIYATKAGGVPAAITPTVTELDAVNAPGLYKLALIAGNVDTLGELEIHVTGSGADPADFKWEISTYLPGEAALLQANQAVNVAQWNGTNVAVPATAGIPDINVKNIVNAAAALDANNLLKVDTEDWKGAAVAGAIPPDSIFIRNGTAQAGAANSITLDAGASATNNFYNNEVIFIRSGTGAGQTNIITAYNGTTKVATVAFAWAVNPDLTSVFSILSAGPSAAASVLGTVGANVTQWNGSAVPAPAVAGVPVVDLKYILGTLLSETVAGNLAAAFKKFFDVAASVFTTASVNQTGDAYAVANTRLPAALTANGNIKGALEEILTTALTESVGGRLAGGFKEFLDVASQVLNLASVNQTGDGFARLGAPSGASIDADILADKTRIWDEVLTAATHNVASSAGRRLRQLSQVVLFDGLVQSATAYSITFQAGPSATNDVYIGDIVVLNTGAGVGQARTIVDWNGTTLTAVLNTPLTTVPALGDGVQIQAFDTQQVIEQGAVTGVPTSTTVPLESTASAVNNIYVGALLLVQNAGGPDSELRVITAYNGTTKVATVSPALNRTPAAGDAYSVWAVGRAMADVNNDKTGYALTAAEHTAVAADTQTGLTAQGYTTARAGFLDTLNGLVAAIWNALTSGMTTVGSIGLLLATNVNAAIGSVSNKLGAWTGAGTSNLFNWLQAMFRNDAGVTTPADIGGTYSNLTMALQAIAAGGGGGGSTATQIWNFLTSGIVTTGSIGKFILSISSTGVGSLLCTFTVQVAGLPKDGVDTWITTDAAGLNIVARATSSNGGVVQFLLDPGSYYWWKELSGFTWTPNPQPITVS